MIIVAHSRQILDKYKRHSAIVSALFSLVSFIGIARALSRMQHATIKGEPMAKFARLLIEKAIKHPREPNAARLPSPSNPPLKRALKI